MAESGRFAKYDRSLFDLDGKLMSGDVLALGCAG
jgi:hypothetical protein